ncbi:putative membrane protein [Halalkaliarchaeum sp. AArc-CO]|uniref:glycosyltransferase family 87 protein n=1 Tax=unclassified Halalkaliarchaeum TaxID=2678344 RepID=UPI00217D442B|nr:MULTISPECIES: glycosyltransferase family 87 protein [unclassified Halalkaliarchaeum]MDR5671538.1 glycosyltransferase family 87 protein [Halalkaliarchaeum sp. AArc-GB]UWG51038.1 putative membrane protein [Halalkaliarchaeum sp. AArc-CO]
MSVLDRLWEIRNDQPGFVSLAVLVMGAIAAYPVVDLLLRSAEISTAFRYYDFGAYRIAVDDWQAGEPIYEPNEEGGFHGNYLYPPIALPIFAAFLAAFENPGIAWGVLSVLALWVSLQLAIREFGLSMHPLERLLLLWLLVGFQPILFGFKMGQVSTFLAALLTLALVGLIRDLNGRGRSAAIASGVFTTLGSSVKLVYAPSGAHLLRCRRRFAGAIAALFALIGLSLLLFDPATHRSYLDVLLWGKGWGTGSRSPHLWTPAYFRPLLAIESVGLAVRGLLIVSTIGLAIGAQGPEADLPTFALGIAIIPLAAPRAYTFDLVVLLPAVLVLLALELDRTDGRPELPVLGLLFLHVHAYGVFTFGRVSESLLASNVLRPLLPVLQPGLWGALLLVGLAFVRVAEHTAIPTHARRITSFNSTGD